MRKQFAFMLVALFLVLAACAPKPYEPAGEPTGNAALDDAVLSLLQEQCSAKNSEQENLRAVYDFILPTARDRQTRAAVFQMN